MPLSLSAEERDGISDISFLSPEICIGISGDALATLSRTANTRSIAAAVIECDDVIFVRHEMWESYHSGVQCACFRV